MSLPVAHYVQTLKELLDCEGLSEFSDVDTGSLTGLPELLAAGAEVT